MTLEGGSAPSIRIEHVYPLLLLILLPQGTVGAGLPVMGTLKHLLETGDKIIKIEGILSGTLSYIFNTFGDGRPFSEVVADAKAKGYTEPDPRDDLNGTDVARKVRTTLGVTPNAYGTAALARKACAVRPRKTLLWLPSLYMHLRLPYLEFTRPLKLMATWSAFSPV